MLVKREEVTVSSETRNSDKVFEVVTCDKNCACVCVLCSL